MTASTVVYQPFASLKPPVRTVATQERTLPKTLPPFTPAQRAFFDEFVASHLSVLGGRPPDTLAQARARFLAILLMLDPNAQNKWAADILARAGLAVVYRYSGQVCMATASGLVWATLAHAGKIPGFEQSPFNIPLAGSGPIEEMPMRALAGRVLALAEAGLLTRRTPEADTRILMQWGYMRPVRAVCSIKTMEVSRSRALLLAVLDQTWMTRALAMKGVSASSRIVKPDATVVLTMPRTTWERLWRKALRGALA
jgi:hypothetical protein